MTEGDDVAADGLPRPATAGAGVPAKTLLPPPPGTCAIQAPPPPEKNAAVDLAGYGGKDRRNPSAGAGSICLPCLVLACAVLLGVVILAVIAVLAAVLVVHPSLPIFSLQSFSVSNSSSTKRVDFIITMKASNPSSKMGYRLYDGPAAAIFSGGKRLGIGDPPELALPAGGRWVAYKLVFHGAPPAAATKLPKAVQRGLRGSPETVGFSMSMRCPARLEIDGARMWAVVEVKVDCEFRARSLAKGTKIVAQRCTVKVGK